MGENLNPDHARGVSSDDSNLGESGGVQGFRKNQVLREALMKSTDQRSSNSAAMRRAAPKGPLVNAKAVESDAVAGNFKATVEFHFECAPQYTPATDKLAKGAFDAYTHLG